MESFCSFKTYEMKIARFKVMFNIQNDDQFEHQHSSVFSRSLRKTDYLVGCEGDSLETSFQNTADWLLIPDFDGSISEK